jgi:hypothetical protein
MQAKTNGIQRGGNRAKCECRRSMERPFLRERCLGGRYHRCGRRGRVAVPGGPELISGDARRMERISCAAPPKRLTEDGTPLPLADGYLGRAYKGVTPSQQERDRCNWMNIDRPSLNRELQRM